MAAAAREHAGDGGGEAVQEAFAVDVNGLGPLLGLVVVHHGEVHDACDANKDVDGSQFGFGGFDQGVDLFGFRDVGFADDDFAFAHDEAAFDFFQGIDAAGAEGDVAAFAGEGGGDGGADAGACAGDDGDFAGKDAFADWVGGTA